MCSLLTTATRGDRRTKRFEPEPPFSHGLSVDTQEPVAGAVAQPRTDGRIKTVSQFSSAIRASFSGSSTPQIFEYS